MNKFWRITPQSMSERRLLGRAELIRGCDFIGRLKAGHGIVMADWNDGSATGAAKALGVVLSTDAPRERLWWNGDRRI